MQKATVTINIPDRYVGCMELLVKKRVYKNRSEIVRLALSELLNSDGEFSRDISSEMFENHLIRGGVTR